MTRKNHSKGLLRPETSIAADTRLSSAFSNVLGTTAAPTQIGRDAGGAKFAPKSVAHVGVPAPQKGAGRSLKVPGPKVPGKGHR